jgi:hypothetical protein
MISFGIDRSGVFGRVYNATETIMDRNLRAFIDFISLELELHSICIVTWGVSGRSERRYLILSHLHIA